MAKHRVQLFNQSRGVDVDTDATPGATVGVNLTLEDGTVVTYDMLFRQPPSDSGDPGAVYWRTIMEVPPNVTALQNTETAGLYVLTGPGGSATRTLTTNTLSLQNASGVDGDPVVDLGELEDAGTGALLAVERDQYGRVAGTKPATITGVEGEVTVEHGDAVGGLPTVGLADVPDEGGGALQRFQRDGKGRVSGTSEATTDDLPEGSNLYFTDERADARVDAGIAEHVAQPDPHPQYTTASEAAAAAPVQSVNGKQGTVVLGAADVGAAASDDSRLTNSREWTASTVPQAEAEAGTATTRRAWTAQRVHQAVRAAVLTGLSTTTNAAITATDSVLSALGKLQAQVSSKASASAVWALGATGPTVPNMGSTDLNDARGAHALYANGSPNRPSGGGNGFVWGISQTISGLDYGVQEWGRMGRRFFRSLEGGNWRDWQEYWHTGNFTPAEKADLAGADFSGPLSVNGANFHALHDIPRVGIGTAAPAYALHIESPQAGIFVSRSHATQESFFLLVNDGDLDTGGQWRGLRSGGLRATHAGFPTQEWLRITATTVRPGIDNAASSGDASARWTEVFATTGTINTSDAREKTDPRDLTEAELSAAADIARLPCIFQWLHAIEEKGEDARLHASPTVQAVIAAMEAHGLDPFRYGFVCYDEWPETPEVKDEETGEVTQEYRPAGDRYSLRPTELAHFVLRGLAHRQDELERRLVALEG